MPKTMTKKISTVGGPATGDDINDRKCRIIDFGGDFSIETTPHSAAKIDDFRSYLKPGTSVAVTFLVGSNFEDTFNTAKRLKEEGFNPVPHFPARMIPNKDELEHYLKRFRDKVGITEVLVIAGGVDRPVGEFDNSMQLLETGLFEKYGIKKIGVAGHPEGSPSTSEEDLSAALVWKNAYANRSDAELYIVTQFCLDAGPVITWEKAIRSAGNKLPIQVGVPGPATMKTLFNYAKACGVGASLYFLTKHARSVFKLMTVNMPDRLIMDLAEYCVAHPECRIRKVHIYPFGGLHRSARWIYAVAEGDFSINADGDGFTVNCVIT